MAAQAGLCLAWSETPEDTFCRVVALFNQKVVCYIIIENQCRTQITGVQILFWKFGEEQYKFILETEF